MQASRAVLARIEAALTLATVASPRITASTEQSNAIPRMLGERSRPRSRAPARHCSARSARRIARNVACSTLSASTSAASPSEAPGQAAGTNLDREPLAARRRESLGIGESRNRPGCVENYRGRNHGAGQRSATGLIHPRRGPGRRQSSVTCRGAERLIGRTAAPPRVRARRRLPAGSRRNAASGGCG